MNSVILSALNVGSLGNSLSHHVPMRVYRVLGMTHNNNTDQLPFEGVLKRQEKTGDW